MDGRVTCSEYSVELLGGGDRVFEGGELRDRVLGGSFAELLGLS
jgi:hypothetical protein